MTATDRLTLLLPLANRDDLTERELRRRVFQFLHKFEARGLRLQRGHQQELWDAHDATLRELQRIAEKVVRVFDAGLLFTGPPGEGTEGITPDDIRLPLSFPSLRFGAFSPEGRQRGSFALMVEAGRLRDLVPYLTMHLLTTEETRIARCHAPKVRDWAHECGRVFIWSGQGRPPLVCSRGCARRVKAKRVNEQARRERKEWQAKHPTWRRPRIQRGRPSIQRRKVMKKMKGRTR